MRKTEVIVWQNFTLGGLTVPYTLCLNTEEFGVVMDYLGVPKNDHPRHINYGANATAHFCDHKGGDKCVVVCMAIPESVSNIQIAGLLVHEATHIWQDACERMNEQNPGDEIEAYSIQTIWQGLADLYTQKLVTGSS